MNLVVILLAGVASTSLPDAGKLRSALFDYPTEVGEVASVGESVEWTGPGKVQADFAVTYRERRQVALDRAVERLKKLASLLDSASAAKPGKQREVARLSLQGFSVESLADIEKDLLEAVKWEGKRIRMLKRAVKNATREGAAIPDLDVIRLENAAVLVENGVLEGRVKKQAEGYRLVAQGYSDYLSDNLVEAMKKMEAAAEALPDVALPHVLMGSFYFLARGQEPALAEWRKALELDPENAELKQIIEQLSTTEE